MSGTGVSANYNEIDPARIKPIASDAPRAEYTLGLKPSEKQPVFPVNGALGPESLKLGKLVRDTWVRWAKVQPNPKPSWLIPWEDLDENQKAAGILIGHTVAEYVSRNHPFPDLTGKQKIAQLEDRCTDYATAVNSLYKSAASKAVQLALLKQTVQELIDALDFQPTSPEAAMEKRDMVNAAMKNVVAAMKPENEAGRTNDVNRSTLKVSQP